MGSKINFFSLFDLYFTFSVIPVFCAALFWKVVLFLSSGDRMDEEIMLQWAMDSWFEVIFTKGLKGIGSLTVSCYLVKEMGLVPEMWFGKPGTMNG
jgi:hypothetical protein